MKIAALALALAPASLTPVAAAVEPVVAVAPHPAPTAQAEAYHHFLRARLALSSADYSQAITEYEKASARDPGSSVIPAELAEVYLRLRRPRDAARESERALAIDPRSLDALQSSARAYDALGETEKALSALRRLVDADPRESSHLVQLASLLDRAGRPDEAVEVLEEAVLRSPGASAAAFELVDRFRGLGRLDRALEVLETAARADANNVYLQSKLAELYIQLRRPQQAMVALGAMVDLQPDNVEVLMEVGNALRGLDLNLQAARLFARALELSGGDDGIRLQLAATLASLGDLRNARDQYQMLLQSRSRPGITLSSEEHFALLKRIGWLSSEIGDVEASRDTLERARPMAPRDDVDFIRLLARSYDRLGLPAKSLAVFETGAKGRALDDRASSDVHTGVAAYEIITGDLKAGIAKYEKLIELGGLAARQHGFVAQALLRRGDQTGAEQALRRAVAAAPGEEEQTYVSVAGMLFEVGAKEQAFELIEGLLLRIPDREIFQFLAARYAQYGKSDRAITTLERAVLAFPKDAQLHFQLGAHYDRAKRTSDGDRTLEAAIALDGKHAGALNYLSYSWADRGVELDKSLDYALRAVALEPKNGAYLDTLGWAYFRIGRLVDAKSRLVEALEHVDDPVIRDHLGDVLSKLGEHADALAAYEQAATMPGANEITNLDEKIAAARARTVEAASPTR